MSSEEEQNNGNILSEAEKVQYRQLLRNAFQATNAYNGSEQTYDELFEALFPIDEFVRSRNNDTSSDTLEAEFSSQASDLDAQFNIVSDFIDHAYDRVYGMLGRLHDLREMLNFLSLGGAYIYTHEDVFVLNDGTAFSGDGENPRTITEFQRQPRLAILIKELNGIGIHTDDLVVRVGRIFENTIRRLPYIVVEIPRLEKQVAVCDQYGEATFVTQRVIHPGIWASMTKQQLAALDGVTRLPFTTSWPFKVCNLLEYGTDDMTPPGANDPDPDNPDGRPPDTIPPKVDVHEYMRNQGGEGFQLSEDIIINHIALHLQAQIRAGEPKLPTENSGSVITLHGQNWKTWDCNLRLTQNSIEDKSSLSQLIHDWIAEQALKYHEQNEEWPAFDKDGHMPDHPEISWTNLDRALLNNGNNSMSLETVLAKAELIEGFDGALSEAIITKHIALYLEEQIEVGDPKFPRHSSENVTTLHGQKWKTWSDNLQYAQNGINNKSSLFKLTLKWITEQALKYHEKTEEWPAYDKDGHMPDHPEISWANLDKALLNHGSNSITLKTALVKAELIEGFDGTLSEELIIKHLALHLQAKIEIGKPKFPSRTENVLTLRKQNWATWDFNLKNAQNGIDSKSSLSKLTLKWITEQALKYHEKTEEWPAYDKEGCMPDHPKISWYNLDKALLNNGNKPMSLEIVLVKARLIEGFDGTLSKKLILKHVALHLQAQIEIGKPKLPTQNSGNVTTLHGQKWEVWNSNLRHARNGIKEKSSLSQLIHDWIAEQALKYHEQNEEWPAFDKDGHMPDHPEISWTNLDRALLNNGNNSMSLETVLVKAELIEGFDGALSEAIITKHIALYLEEQIEVGAPKLANTRSQAVTTLHGQNWATWEASLKRARNGINSKSSLFKLTLKWITEQALKHHEQTEDWPAYDNKEGCMPDYPKISWDNLDKALFSSSGHTLRLENILIQAGLIEAPDNIINEDNNDAHLYPSP